jgi:hypothetical protein
MYIVLKTEHQVISINYNFAEINDFNKKRVFVSFEHTEFITTDVDEVCDFCMLFIDEEPYVCNSNGEKCAVEILEMVPDMRKYL